MKSPEILAARFQKILNTMPHLSTGCWIWNRGKDKCGYGKLIAGSRTDKSRRLFSAHRYSYSFHVGPIPAGLSVLHKCDTRACINPNHLYVGTQSQNVRDAVRRGRWVQGKLLAEQNRRSTKNRR